MSFLSSSFRSPTPDPQHDSRSPTANLSFTAPFVSSLTSTLGMANTPSTLATSTVGGDGGVGTVNINGKVLFCIHNVDAVCKGKIGSSSKVCCKPASECAVARHKVNKAQNIQPGYYIKASECEIIPAPFVARDLVNEELGRILLETEFKPKQLNAVFQVLNNQENPGIIDFDELKAQIKGLDVSNVLQTPALKRQKMDSLEDKLQAIVTSWEEGTDDSMKLDKEDEPMSRRQMAEFGTFAVNCLLKDEQAIYGLGQQLELLRAIIGNDLNTSKHASVWSALQEVQDHINNFTSKFQNLERDSVTTNYVDTKLMQVGKDLNLLNKNAKDAFLIVESKLLSLEAKAASVNPAPSTSFLNPANPGQSVDNVARGEIAKLQQSIANLQPQPSPAPGGQSSGKPVVSIGQYKFRTIHDLAAWAAVHMPSSLPFGGFVDVYSYLERVNSFKDIAPSTVLKSMEIRQKLDLTADEALIIESFKHALPRIFNGTSSGNSNNFTSWLPGIQTKDKWEDNAGLSGAKVTIRDNEASIRLRIEEVINQRLDGYPEAQSMARVLLSDTITFVGAVIRFISETYKRLEESGFGKTESWKLVSKLVHRLFATDCHHKRGAVTEFLDASDAKTLSLGVLWGTLSTHQVMREYTAYGIENHPSISSEYVRFLVANCGLERIHKLETSNEKLTAEVAELKKSLASANKSLSTVANKAEEALKLAKKRPRQE